MGDEFDIGSRASAVESPQILTVLPYIAKRFPQTITDARGKLIYHYTTSNGLVGMLQNGSIWASNYAFLNDPSERIHCITKAKEAMNKVQNGRSELVKEMLNQLRSELDGEGGWTEYIASFCENGDLLSQWRAYAAGASGYSVGFDAERLRGNLAQTARLEKVIYDSELQLEILINVCEIIAEFVENEFRNNGNIVETMLDFYASQFVNIIWSLCSKMKHEAYSEEKEWRLVFMKPSRNDGETRIFDEHVHFRARGSTIVPYVNIPFGEPRNIQDHEEYYPVRRIVIGPTENSGVAKKGVELLCESINRKITVASSSIPARQF
ncbi:DUF2971 domain-containing protein [Acidithiobacillus ferriphilus]|uniref:DUF2971 domain-containing protein n=1 Tax=Acidithiobacillus ferriphilus TaxID=1689834 RepID=UPI001C078E0E|nr:DUF2971 domain-containing protein [Acidithiobacillus ferriphilus]MBU2846794.1 DUF2971 domain-containing protein [Acidithiobacillus ferriphilus]